MLLLFFGALAARIATVLAAVTVALPYLLRRRARQQGTISQRPSSFIRRLWPHFWAGYVIAAFTMLHMFAAMNAIARANVAGIWAATLAFFLLLFEIIVGLSLKEQPSVGRKALRRFHFWAMFLFLGALGMHLALNI